MSNFLKRFNPNKFLNTPSHYNAASLLTKAHKNNNKLITVPPHATLSHYTKPDHND